MRSFYAIPLTAWLKEPPIGVDVECPQFPDLIEVGRSSSKKPVVYAMGAGERHPEVEAAGGRYLGARIREIENPGERLRFLRDELPITVFAGDAPEDVL